MPPFPNTFDSMHCIVLLAVIGVYQRKKMLAIYDGKSQREGQLHYPTSGKQRPAAIVLFHGCV
jgi:poly(3-hydroxybutyrate) depolymerase